MKRNLVILSVSLVALGAGRDARAFGGGMPVESASRQFVIFGRSTALPFELTGLAADTNYIVLQPTLLAVSCERIKQALYRDLRTDAPWRGRIFLNLRPARSAADGITVVSERFSDGWNYWVDVPELVRRDRFMRAMVEVLLREFANRNNPGRAAAIPLWLAEGLAQELPAASQIELFLPPPTWDVRGLVIRPQDVSERWTSPLKIVKEETAGRPLLTFEQLSWPDDARLSGQSRRLYRASAQLFVHQLLALRDGPACLQEMLRQLPRFYNWQLAFLAGFQPCFRTALDVEKWWALQVVQFTGRDLAHTWTPAESRAKLAQMLRARVDVRTEKNQLPLHTTVSLQSVLNQWNRAQQIGLLERKLRELDLLRLRMAPQALPLADAYRRTLAAYLKKISATVSISTSGKQPGRPPPETADSVVKQLDLLDAQLAARQPRPPTKPASGNGTLTNREVSSVARGQAGADGE